MLCKRWYVSHITDIVKYVGTYLEHVRSARCKHILGWVGINFVLVWLLFVFGFGLVGLVDEMCGFCFNFGWFCLMLVLVRVDCWCWVGFCFGVGSAWLAWFGLAWFVIVV